MSDNQKQEADNLAPMPICPDCGEVMPEGARMGSRCGVRPNREAEIVAKWLRMRENMGAPMPMWSTLDREERERWMRHAREWLSDHRPLLMMLYPPTPAGAP